MNCEMPTRLRPKEKTVIMNIQKTMRLMIAEGCALTPPLSRKATMPAPAAHLSNRKRINNFSTSFRTSQLRMKPTIITTIMRMMLKNTSAKLS